MDYPRTIHRNSCLEIIVILTNVDSECSGFLIQHLERIRKEESLLVHMSKVNVRALATVHASFINDVLKERSYAPYKLFHMSGCLEGKYQDR